MKGSKNPAIRLVGSTDAYQHLSIRFGETVGGRMSSIHRKET
jgi:hypothetical protein